VAQISEAKFLLAPGWESQFYALPKLNPALQAVGRGVTVRMRANVSGPRVGPFKRRSFVKRDPEHVNAAVAGTTWKLAHLFEFGSANTTAHGWLRSACMGIPSTRFEPGQSAGAEE
jgi:hypothetical protein